MEYNFKDLRIVITGGAGGIGYATANKFLNEGANIVILLDIDDTNGTKAAKTLNDIYGIGRAIYIKCNVVTEVNSVFETIVCNYKRIDVLVNSAGIGDERVPRRMIDINATSLVEWSLKFYDHMRIDKGGNGGTIINVSSILGYRIAPFFPVYQMTKFAVLGFTRSLGHDYNFKKSHVRVISLCPGFTHTNLAETIKKNSEIEELSEDEIAFAQGHVWQEADDVGKAALDMCKIAKSGSAWLIEGGQPIVEIVHYE